MGQVWVCQLTLGLQPSCLWCDVHTARSILKNLRMLSSAYLLSHSCPHYTHDISCSLPDSTFFFLFVPLCIVFSLPGSHYFFHSSTEFFYFSPEMSIYITSSRTLPWCSLFSSFQIRLDADILYSQKYSQLPFVTALSYHILITCLVVCLPHQTKDLEGSSIFSLCNTESGLGWPQKSLCYDKCMGFLSFCEDHQLELGPKNPACLELPICFKLSFPNCFTLSTYVGTTSSEKQSLVCMQIKAVCPKIFIAALPLIEKQIMMNK